MMPRLSTFFCVVVNCAASSPAQLPFVRGLERSSLVPPTWNQSWAIANSTSIYACNYSDFLDIEFISKFALVQLDWSNAKERWANAHPMNSDDLMVEQAARIKAARPGAIVMVYRNTVKALSWFTHVREKLVDPHYSGYFLPYGRKFPVSPACDEAYNPPLCSPLFHDQMQTPQFRPPPDDGLNGTCFAPCDCGGVPTGEYLWDLRNASARAFLIDEVVGPTGCGNPNITGLYLDDYWVNQQQPVNPSWNQPPWGYCTFAPTGGPSEIQLNCIDDMGLSQADVDDLTAGWQMTYSGIFSAMDKAGALAYSSFTFASTPGPTDIRADLEANCAAGNLSAPYNAALQLIFTTPPGCCPPDNNTTLLQFNEDLAYFMLIRGPWAWIGYSWEWCAPHYDMPAGLFVDYGDPVDTCSETSPGSGVFTRTFANAVALFDTNTYSGMMFA